MLKYKPKKIKFDMELKNLLLERYSFFSQKSSSETVLHKRELLFNNHKSYLYGYHNDDTTSIDLIYSILETKKVSGIILSESNRLKINSYNNRNEALKRMTIYPYSQENIVAKNQYEEFFNKYANTNEEFYVDGEEDYVVSLDEIRIRQITDFNLSIAFWACKYEDKKNNIRIFHGNADTFNLIEDICLNFSLNELQEIFVNTLKNYKLSGEESENSPSLFYEDFLDELRLISQETNSTTLFNKQCRHTATIFKKVNLIYNNNFLFAPNYLVDRTYYHITDPYLEQTEAILTLLNNNSNNDLNITYKEKTDIFLKETIEKLIILFFIYSDVFEQYIENDVNPFKSHLFFNGIFANFEDDLIFNIYDDIKEFYMGEIKKARKQDILRLDNDSISFRSRSFIIPQQAELQALKEKEIKLISNYQTKETFLEIANMLVLIKAIMNLQQRSQNGENTNYQKAHLIDYLTDNRNEHNEQVFKSLIAEANAELQLLKLPSYEYREFKCYIENVYKTKFINEIGYDYEKSLEKAMIQVYNQSKEIDSKLIKEGSEPMMKLEEFSKNNQEYFKKMINLPKEILIGSQLEKVKKMSIKAKKNDKNIIEKIDSLVETGESSTKMLSTLKNELNKEIKEINPKEKTFREKINQLSVKKGFLYDDLPEGSDEDDFEENENDAEDETYSFTKSEMFDDLPLEEFSEDTQLINAAKNDPALQNLAHNEIISKLKNMSVEELREKGYKDVVEARLVHDKFNGLAIYGKDGQLSYSSSKNDLMNLGEDGKEMVNLIEGSNTLPSNIDLGVSNYEALSERKMKEEMFISLLKASKGDDFRIKKIEMDLETGQSLDSYDPLYYEFLVTSKQNLLKREEYLKRYYRNDDNPDVLVYKKLEEELIEAAKLKYDEDYYDKKFNESDSKEGKLFKSLYDKYIDYEPNLKEIDFLDSIQTSNPEQLWKEFDSLLSEKDKKEIYNNQISSNDLETNKLLEKPGSNRKKKKKH